VSRAIGEGGRGNGLTLQKHRRARVKKREGANFHPGKRRKRVAIWGKVEVDRGTAKGEEEGSSAEYHKDNLREKKKRGKERYLSSGGGAKQGRPASRPAGDRTKIENAVGDLVVK